MANYTRTNHIEPDLVHSDADVTLQLLVSINSDAGHTQLLKEVIVTDVETGKGMRAWFDAAYEELEKAFALACEKK